EPTRRFRTEMAHRTCRKTQKTLHACTHRSIFASNPSDATRDRSNIGRFAVLRRALASMRLHLDRSAGSQSRHRQGSFPWAPRFGFEVQIVDATWLEWDQQTSRETPSGWSYTRRSQ